MACQIIYTSSTRKTTHKNSEVPLPQVCVTCKKYKLQVPLERHSDIRTWKFRECFVQPEKRTIPPAVEILSQIQSKERQAYRNDQRKEIGAHNTFKARETRKKKLYIHMQGYSLVCSVSSGHSAAPPSFHPITCEGHLRQAVPERRPPL